MKYFTKILVPILLITCITSNLFGGESNINEEKTLILENFTGIRLNEFIKVYISQSDKQEVIVKGNSTAINLLKTNVYAEIWDITLKEDESFDKSNVELSIYIKVPDINLITINGSGIVEINKFKDQKDLELNVNGNGSIKSADKITGLNKTVVHINGNGFVKLIGDCADIDININGTGNYSGFEMLSNNANAVIYGTGNCEIYAKSTLSALTSGTGNIYYKGEAQVTKQIWGTGSIMKK